MSQSINLKLGKESRVYTEWSLPQMEIREKNTEYHNPNPDHDIQFTEYHV